ncbi:MAG TPA: ParB/RepB/Spo0J family partition protein [Blastocatellia bacterium]|nr:ParB/RepB/Spo0J family partition protein [Blastocatellia bacterium]
MSRKALGRGLSALFPETRGGQSDLLELQIDLLDPSQYQPRTSFNNEAMDELAASIKARGIIQPLVVRRKGERFEIVAGERRWRAAQRAGLKQVPCVVKAIRDENVLEVSLIENIQRQELNAIEEANAFRRLVEELGITQEEVARRVGKERSSITNSLRLLKLPAEVQKLVEDDKLSMGHARALLAISPMERQKTIAIQIVERGLSVREIERLGKKTEGTRRARDPERSRKSANVSFAEQKLSRRLGAPVNIKFSGKGGAIEIRFTSSEDLSRIFDLLIKRPAQ